MKAQGGIDGHPVKQIVLDDAGDPARYKAGSGNWSRKRRSSPSSGTPTP